MCLCCNLGAGSSSISAPSWGKPSSRLPSFGKTAEPSGQHNAIEMPKFNFRPPRPLTDSAEKLRLEQQRQVCSTSLSCFLTRDRVPKKGRIATRLHQAPVSLLQKGISPLFGIMCLAEASWRVTLATLYTILRGHMVRC